MPSFNGLEVLSRSLVDGKLPLPFSEDSRTSSNDQNARWARSRNSDLKPRSQFPIRRFASLVKTLAFLSAPCARHLLVHSAAFLFKLNFIDDTVTNMAPVAISPDLCVCAYTPGTLR